MNDDNRKGFAVEIHAKKARNNFLFRAFRVFRGSQTLSPVFLLPLPTMEMSASFETRSALLSFRVIFIARTRVVEYFSGDFIIKRRVNL